MCCLVLFLFVLVKVFGFVVFAYFDGSSYVCVGVFCVVCYVCVFLSVPIC